MRAKYIFISIILIVVSACSSTDYAEIMPDKNIVWAIPAKYVEADSFATAIAAVQDSDGACFIGKDAGDVFNKRLSNIRRPSEEKKYFVNKLPGAPEDSFGYKPSADTTIINRDGSVAEQNDFPEDTDDLSKAALGMLEGGDASFAIADILSRRGFGPNVVKGENNLYGIVNTLGQWIVEPQFDGIQYYDDEFMQVEKDGTCGFSVDGINFVMVPDVHRIEPFVQEYALVIMYDIDYTEYNFIDKQGHLIFDKHFMIKDSEQYFPSPSYSDGLFSFLENDKYGYMDKDKNVIIEPKYDDVNPFSEGLAAIINDNKLAYVNMRGEVVIPYRNGEWGGQFQNGMAAVTHRYTSGGVNVGGVIDTNGDWIVEPNYDHCHYDEYTNTWKLEHGDKTDVFFVDSKVLVKNFTLIEHITKNAVFGFRSAFFSERHCIATIDNGKVHMEYLETDHVCEFSEGLAVVMVNDRHGFTDYEGNWIIAPRFEDSRPFSEGLAAVKVDGQWGYIANPLVYSRWSADERERAEILDLIPDDTPDGNSIITESAFASILAMRLPEKNRTVFSESCDAGDTDMSHERAAYIISSYARALDEYYPHYFPMCPDSGQIADAYKRDVAFTTQMGIIEPAIMKPLNPKSAVHWDEAISFIVRTYECFLDATNTDLSIDEYFDY